DFFRGPLTTALMPDEIITELRLPAWPAKRRFGFCEFARRRGDFALAGTAVFYDEDGGKVANAHVGALGVSDRPVRLRAVEEALNGKPIDEATIAQAETEASAAVDPPDDIHATGAYRKTLIGVMVERALRSALAR
ncbi:MAG: xanthine dehydrogenase family protein subunit M, partial [Xanthobacteraceae bacterium]